MKSIRIIAVIVSALFILSFTANADAQNKNKSNKTQEITFVVKGMDCANCKKKMDAKLPFEKGVKDYKSDLKAEQYGLSMTLQRPLRRHLRQL